MDADQPVSMPAGLVLALLDYADPPRPDTPGVPGAEIIDLDRGLVYRATTVATPQGPKVRSIEVRTQGDRPLTPALVRATPLQAIADEVAVLAAARQSASPTTLIVDDGTGPAGGLELPSDTDGVPTSEEVAALLRAGETRRTIAARYERSVTAVDKWIGRARRERPDLMPPKRTGRPSKAEQSTHNDTTNRGDAQ